MSTPLNMKELIKNNKRLVLIMALAVVVIAGVSIYYSRPGDVRHAIFGGPRIIEETIKIPTESSQTNTDGLFPNKEAYNVPFVSQNSGEQVVVSGAVLTPRGAYLIALPVAQSWSPDAKLIFIKSLGTVMVDGKSLGWQVVFGSKTKKLGYEVVIDREMVVVQKEIPSKVFGADVPTNFAERDAGWAIGRLAENPQFINATMTGLNFVYNLDAKAWDYVIAHSFGGSSVRVR